MLETLINYLQQASTWRGIISIATAAGVVLSPELQVQIIATGLALMGLINVIRNEKKTPPTVEK